ncbi:MAG: hypothetical protein HYY06_29655 [Deltaproteobacteria bacterium]|nr:hypothetical protein [Deltaproteobacteria bacterium]
MQPNEQADHDGCREGSIAKLRECLEAELAAAESYEIALRRTRDVELASLLRMMHDSHERRAIMVWSELVAAGGDPPRSVRAWDAVGSVERSGTNLLAAREAVTALVEGEDRSTRLYSENLERCEPRVRELIRRQLLPEQFDTLQACASLRSLLGP